MGTDQGIRALIVIRLSRVTEATTSPERQELECRRYAESRGWDIAGVVADLDVSGSKSPFERENLGAALADPGAYNLLIFYRIDRLTRSMLDLAKVMKWAEAEQISLVSATETHFDTTTAAGRLIALLVASFAEMELEAISARNRNAFAHNYSQGKWRGGVPPWGYLPAMVDGEWRLVQDSDQVEVIREVVERILGGGSLAKIARDLTARGVLTSKDAFAESQGREVMGYSWHISPLRRALRSETLRGYAISKGEVIRGADGAPLVRAEAILDGSTWRRLQGVLDGSAREAGARRNQSLLAGILWCGVCGRPMWILRGGRGRIDRYRCQAGNSAQPCGNRTIGAPLIEDWVMGHVREMWWGTERTRSVRVAGYDPGAEREGIEAEMSDIAGVVGRPGYRTGDAARARIDARMAALAARMEELADVSVVQSGWTTEGTGETVSDFWEAADAADRNRWIRGSGIAIWVDKRVGCEMVTMHQGSHGQDISLVRDLILAESAARAGTPTARNAQASVKRAKAALETARESGVDYVRVSAVPGS